MKRIAIMLLLAGALLGLAAQASAHALAPTVDARTAAAMPDCMAAMDQPAPHKSGDCTRADCIAALLGGAPLFTVASPAGDIAAPATSALLRPRPAPAVRLAGRNPGPEPDPPNAPI